MKCSKRLIKSQISLLIYRRKNDRSKKTAVWATTNSSKQVETAGRVQVLGWVADPCFNTESSKTYEFYLALATERWDHDNDFYGGYNGDDNGNFAPADMGGHCDSGGTMEVLATR